MRGRKPKSTELKKLSGTFKPTREKGLAGGDLITKIPPPPGFLQEEAVERFKWTCSILIQGRRLYASDLHLVAMFAGELYTYELASRNLQTPADHITTTPAGGDKPSPWIQIKNQALKNVKELGALFGLDPMARERMKPQAKEEPDPLEEILNMYK
ncbi:MAG TPA: P27 family phage terminase small subunit [Methanobacteriaceae archaeon]|nr:P27 family phage terminase small subunit [Methanobacteriaceae archaeon]